MTTTTREPKTPRIFRRPGSHPASIDEVIGEMQADMFGARDPKAAARRVRAFARMSSFELWENILRWRLAVDLGESEDRELDMFRLRVALRIDESQPFRLPQLSEMPKREKKSIRRKFLRYSIDEMKDALDYGCGIDETSLRVQIREFETLLRSGNY